MPPGTTLSVIQALKVQANSSTSPCPKSPLPAWKHHWGLLLPLRPFLPRALCKGAMTHVWATIWLLHHKKRSQKETAGTYLGWPGFECGPRAQWCFPRQWRRSSARPSCSRALQHPRRTAAPGAGSGRGTSCWRTCQTAGGKQICCNRKQHGE